MAGKSRYSVRPADGGEPVEITVQPGASPREIRAAFDLAVKQRAAKSQGGSWAKQDYGPTRIPGILSDVRKPRAFDPGFADRKRDFPKAQGSITATPKTAQSRAVGLGARALTAAGMDERGAQRAASRYIDPAFEWTAAGSPDIAVEGVRDLVGGRYLDAAGNLGMAGLDLIPGVGKGASALAMFLGPMAKNANAAMLRKAQDMHLTASKANDLKGPTEEARRQIWDETGWFQGADGQWRFEVSDEALKVKDPTSPRKAGNAAAKAMAKQLGYKSPKDIPWDKRDDRLIVRHAEIDAWNENANGQPLSELMTHPELEAAGYPNIEKMKAGPLTGGGSALGSYFPVSNEIRWKQSGRTAEQKRSTVAHEVQHGIQNYEGFAGGAQVGSARSYEGGPHYESAVRQRDHLLKLLDDPTVSDVSKIQLRRMLPNAEKAINQAAEFEGYRRVAGEVEARNVQRRLPMTAEERMATPPWETQDIPDEEQFVLFKGRGDRPGRFGAGAQMSEPGQPVPSVLGEGKFNKVRIRGNYAAFNKPVDLGTEAEYLGPTVGGMIQVRVTNEAGDKQIIRVLPKDISGGPTGTPIGPPPAGSGPTPVPGGMRPPPQPTPPSNERPQMPSVGPLTSEQAQGYLDELLNLVRAPTEPPTPSGLRLVTPEDTQRGYHSTDEEFDQFQIGPSGAVFLNAQPQTQYGRNVVEAEFPGAKLDLSDVTDLPAKDWLPELEKRGVDTSNIKLDSSLTDPNAANRVYGYTDEQGQHRLSFYELIGQNDYWAGDSNLADELKRQGFTTIRSQPEHAGETFAVLDPEGIRILPSETPQMSLEAPAPPAPIPSALSGFEPPPSGGLVGAESPHMISTRRPTPGRGGVNFLTQGNPDEVLLTQTGQSLRDAPRAFSRNMELLAEEPFMQGFTGSSEDIYGEGVRRAADNLKFIAQDLMAPDLVAASRPWYETANRIAGEAADKFGVPQEAAAGILAAFSPQKPWDINVANMERLLEMNQAGWKSSPKEIQSALKWFDDRVEQGRPNAVTARGPEYAARIMATPLEELTEPFDRYAKVVMTDAVRNAPEVPRILPTGEREGTYGAITWGSGTEMGNALNIMQDPTMETIRGSFLGGGKVPSFYNNIVAPQSLADISTIDTHSAGAASLFPAGSSEPIVYRAMGLGRPKTTLPPAAADAATTGAKGLYGVLSEAHTLAGREMGMLPREVQSVTWEGVRRLWGQAGKTPALKKKATEIWRTSKTPDEARRRLQDLLVK